jgi:hypothetical protein
MKKVLSIACIIFIMNIKAQVIFEHRYDSAATFNASIGGLNAVDQLMIVDFEVSGYQYVKVNRHGKKISIYNMNHALVQTISLASLPLNASSTVGYILYLSEQLFNTDPLKEFMYSCTPSTTSGQYIGIYNENGTLLFSDDTGAVNIVPNTPLQQYPIYNTPSGTKMILSYADGHANVFNLAGTLSTAIEYVNTNLANSTMLANARPNPTNSTTTIEYALPKGSMQGEVVFYNTQGTEAKRFKVDNTFNSLLISTTDIPAGTYYYQLQTGGNASGTKKLIVVK